jgi:hypothetical protein
MKDCCKIGDEEPAGNGKKYTRWVIYVIMTAIVGFVLWSDLNK